jgi:plasmid stabilization system protein ParE
VAERRVEWADAARDDLHAIALHIARDSVANALAVADRIDRRAAASAALATRGRLVAELHRTAETRYREVMKNPGASCIRWKGPWSASSRSSMDAVTCGRGSTDGRCVSG